jgi:hypothetical protein
MNIAQPNSHDQKRQSMEGVQHRKRPFVLGFFALILSLQAVVLPILFFVFLVMPPTSPINYNGEDVPIGSVRLEMLATMSIWFAFAAYVGPGLWEGKPMARHVAFGTYVALPLVMIIAYRQWSEIPWLIFCSAIVGGYLYAKPNVHTFFESYEPD